MIWWCDYRTHPAGGAGGGASVTVGRTDEDEERRSSSKSWSLGYRKLQREKTSSAEEEPEEEEECGSALWTSTVTKFLFSSPQVMTKTSETWLLLFVSHTRHHHVVVHHRLLHLRDHQVGGGEELDHRDHQSHRAAPYHHLLHRVSSSKQPCEEHHDRSCKVCRMSVPFSGFKWQNLCVTPDV